jgi:MFS family permease
MIFAVFMISLCKEYWQFFLAQGVVLGVGQGLLLSPVMAMISKYFQKHRALATGFTIGGSSLGGIIWPIMANELLNKRNVSFEWTMRAMGFTMLPLVSLACMTVRPPVSKSPLPDVKPTRDAEMRPGEKKADLSIIKSRAFQVFCLGVGIYCLTMFTPFFLVTSYAVHIGRSTSLAFYLVSALNAASFFGRISAGLLADKYGCFNLCAIAAFSSAVVAFCWTAVSSPAPLIIWCIAYGYCSGVSLAISVVGNALTTSSHC